MGLKGKQGEVRPSKFGSASTLAVKMVAAMRGLKLEKHRSLWDFIGELSKEGRGEDQSDFFILQMPYIVTFMRIR